MEVKVNSFRIGLLGLLLLATSQCSNQQRFEIMQQNRLQACEQQPIALQESCRAQYRMSYREYRQLREGVTD